MEIAVSRSKISGQVEIPGSKSHTIRAIVLASLAKGTSTIKAPLVSEDTVSCLQAASTLGAWIKRGDDTIWRISGTGGKLLQPAGVIDMGNSGTGLRLFTSIAARADFPISFDGDESLRTRTMASLLAALQAMGAKVESANGKCPLSVTGPINGAEVTIEGKTSQYLSSLLFAAPLLENDTVIHVEGLNEQPYVMITLEWLDRQGIRYEAEKDLSTIRISGSQQYSPFSVRIPVDFSTASFPLVAAALTGGDVQIPNLDFTDAQGDKMIFDYMRDMGVKIETKDNITAIKGPKKLKAFDIDLNATPDALPVLAVAGACAEGTSYLRNVPQARLKETDRIFCMAAELRNMGAQVEEFHDGMAITGTKLKGSGELDSHKDHRIAMALTIAAMAAEGESVIKDAECADVTYPGFIDDFRNLGAKITEFTV